MAAPKNKTKLAREAQLLTVSKLYLARVPQHEIADRLNVHINTVSRDLRILRDRWYKASQEEIAKRKAEELARIDRLECEYWDAWERSKLEFTSQTKYAETGGVKARQRAAVKTEDRNGDPRYLSGVQWCIQKRAEIIGINAPTQSEITLHDATDALAEFDRFIAGANISPSAETSANGVH